MEESSFRHTDYDWVDQNTEDGYTKQTNSTVSEIMQDFTQFRGKPYKDLTLEDLNGVEFKTIDEVDTFYSYYSLAKGFSMRRHKLDKNRTRTKNAGAQAHNDFDPIHGLHPNVIRDPVVCKTKGSKSVPIRGFHAEIRSKEAGGKCSNCGLPGHNRRTCDVENPHREAHVSTTVNNGTYTTVHADISSKGVSDGDTVPIPEQASNASDSEVEGDSTQTESATLMHHHEEVRPYQFFTGYDNIAHLGSGSHNSSQPHVFHLFPSFHNQSQ